jgi:hypothetical protein
MLTSLMLAVSILLIGNADTKTNPFILKTKPFILTEVVGDKLLPMLPVSRERLIAVLFVWRGMHRNDVGRLLGNPGAMFWDGAMHSYCAFYNNGEIIVQYNAMGIVVWLSSFPSR